jgi:hypothetical protein
MVVVSFAIKTDFFQLGSIPIGSYVVIDREECSFYHRALGALD